MTRTLSMTVAVAALLASGGLALAQTTTYSTDRSTTSRSVQPSYQYQPTNQTYRTNRLGTAETDRLGTTQTDRLGSSQTGHFGTAPMSGSTMEPREPRTGFRERGLGMAGNQFASEGEAKARCGDTAVWVNTRSHVYHFPGTPEFGHTKHGAFMCQADADRAGTFRAAKDEMRARMGTSGSSLVPMRNSFTR
jgi:hypothetical protein